ncbi:hypothetical protein [Hypnocyclicus thermotrophus]|nr:hypothetical protein [Hypnocyclicus thermotrophus]
MYFNINNRFYNDLELIKEKKEKKEIETENKTTIQNKETKFEKILKEEIEETKEDKLDIEEENKKEINVSTIIAKTNSLEYTNGLAANYIRSYILNKYKNTKE